MIKVLHLRNTPGLYGADRWIIALFKGLDKRKIISSNLCFSDNSPDLNNELKKLGFQTYFPKKRSILAQAKLVAKLVKKNNYDIIHSHEYKSDFVALLASFLARVPCITTLHGYSQEKDLKLMLYEFAQKRTLPLFNKVVGHSRSMFKDILTKNILKKKFVVISNAFDTTDIRLDKKNIEKIKKRYDLKNKFVVGYIGQLIQRKRPFDLLKAFRIFSKEVEKSKLMYVGNGQLSGDIKKTTYNYVLDDKVILTGFRKDRLDIMGCFDIIVLPSVLEGIPRVLMEAMALNIPIIATDIPGNRMLIKDGKTGMLVPINDHKKIAEKLFFIHKNKEYKKKIVNNANNFVNKFFNHKLMAEKYQKIYEGLSR